MVLGAKWFPRHARDLEGQEEGRNNACTPALGEHLRNDKNKRIYRHKCTLPDLRTLTFTVPAGE